MGTIPFEKVSDPSKLLPILKNRLPKSCYMYNQAKMQDRFPDIHKFYVLHGEISDSSWIVSTHYREDYGMGFSISALEENSKISRDEAQKMLFECKLFNWDDPYSFICEKWLSKIIYEISVDLKGNTTDVHPCILYYMEPEDSLQIDTRTNDPKLEIKKINEDPKGVDFFLNTWKYTTEGSRPVVERFIKNFESAGVYIDGNLVCGVVTQGLGFLSMLFTLKDHRQKGYGKMCMRFAIKETARNALIPCLIVEVRNQRSVTFHEKLGCKRACVLDAVNFSRPEF